jgi:TPR repeat protein
MRAKDTKAHAAAKAGDIATIRALFRTTNNVEADGDAYRWLLVAADYGHAAGETSAREMLSTSLLRDDPEIAGLAHLDLGEWYLTGKNGLPRDLERGRKHLERAKELVDLELAVDSFSSSRKKLPPDAAAVLDAIFPAPAKKQKKR